jgi:hypothetical protein
MVLDGGVLFCSEGLSEGRRLPAPTRRGSEQLSEMRERERERERENGERAGGLEIKRRNKWLIMRPAREGAKDTKWDRFVSPACRFCRFARSPPDDDKDDDGRVAARLVVGK